MTIRKRESLANAPTMPSVGKVGYNEAYPLHREQAVRKAAWTIGDALLVGPLRPLRRYFRRPPAGR